MSLGISRYIDLTNVEPDEMMLPDADQHRRWIDEDGISIFDLEPYSIKQIVLSQGVETCWYYVDTGEDGHAIRTLKKAKMVLRQTVRMHQEAVLLQIELIKEST